MKRRVLFADAMEEPRAIAVDPKKVRGRGGRGELSIVSIIGSHILE